ncbi:hypothetical protein GCM10023201_33800 [Actinomycetospora corticicola]
MITERRLDGSRHKLRARLSDAGRDAFEGHVAALQEIVDGAGSSLQVAQSRRDDTSI